MNAIAIFALLPTITKLYQQTRMRTENIFETFLRPLNYPLEGSFQLILNKIHLNLYKFSAQTKEQKENSTNLRFK